MAFQTSCGPCHASRDGFDLAYFGFPSADVIRRAVAHVDSATARDIAAFMLGNLGRSARSRTDMPEASTPAVNVA